MSATSLNDITNQLLLKYDEKYNDYYNKLSNINSSIMNKEQLILKENDIIESKDNYINVLKLGLLFVVLFGVATIFFAINKISKGQYIGTIILLIIIYIGILYYVVYIRYYLYSIKNEMNSIGVQMKDYALSELSNVGVSSYTCPTTCTTIGSNSNNNNNAVNTNLISQYSTPTLNIDNQNNVWQYGNIPAGGYISDDVSIQQFYTNPTNIPNYYNPDNSPQQSFGTTYPATIYYKCDWMGPDNTPGLPNTESQTYSTIPCSYRQNYVETGRYICNTDPNVDGISFPNCDDVSIIRSD